ncbi:AidB family quorum-quenching N-acyl homoserine lactonase [Microvirga tunisiensis]|uniref:AidB family quorum-quenching N-acyl homoserine lactonase n=1 Tax=Microvirga tunisiensis TaxID=2108360 RepID=UPI001FCE840E|nr:MBL fold metallo-hydrolase [Microvirga tunisiensis]
MTAPCSHNFGRYEVTCFCDGVFQAPIGALIHIDGETARQSVIAEWGNPNIQLDVNFYALRDTNGITLVDTGGGPSLGPSFGLARIAMRDAGILPEDVSHVLLTHIHDDHVFGLFDGSLPYFANAEVLVPETDMAFFLDPAAREATPEARRGGFSVAERLQETYGTRIQKCPEGHVLPGIEARRLPGHTPGHTGYLLHGNDDTLFIWGDVLHLGALQSRDPNIGMIYDLSPVVAATTRQTALEHAARGGWAVAGGHIGFGRVHCMEDGYRISEL